MGDVRDSTVTSVDAKMDGFSTAPGAPQATEKALSVMEFDIKGCVTYWLVARRCRRCRELFLMCSVSSAGARS